MSKHLYRGSLMLALVLLSAGKLFASDTLRVLFIGNSYIYTNDLPALISNLATSNGDHLIYNSSAPGGFTFQQHSTYAPTISLIAAGNWDYVVLQEQSQRPSFSDAQVATSVYPYAYALDSIVKKYNPCAKTVFYMTWGRKYGDAANCPILPPLCTYKGMDSMLQLRYTIMANDNEAVLCPVARIWRRLINTTSVELYNPDESHPSVHGSYAAACGFYSVFFKKNPAVCTYNSTLSSTDATTIRNAAKTVVYDSLAYWYKFYPLTDAAFGYSAAGTSVTFNNLSLNADSYDWDFGDGNTSSTVSPVHAYAVAGAYTARLIATRCKDHDTATQIVYAGVTGIETVNKDKQLRIYPNPGEDYMHIDAEQGIIESYSITDISGKILLRQEGLQSRSVTYPVRHLVPGHYYLHVTIDQQITTYPFYKR